MDDLTSKMLMQSEFIDEVLKKVKKVEKKNNILIMIIIILVLVSLSIIVILSIKKNK